MDLKAFWMSLPRAARVYVTAVAGVGLAAVAVVITGAATGTPLLAASPSPSPSPGSATNYCSRFTGHVASNLGKSQSQVQKAISDAINQTIDDAVKNGDLTQSQANAIKSKVSSNANGNQACAGNRGGWTRIKFVWLGRTRKPRLVSSRLSFSRTAMILRKFAR